MGYYLRVVDCDKVFNRLQAPPIIVNDVDLASKEAKEEFNAMLTTQYDGDVLQNAPSCGCGQLNKGHQLGRICDNCHTPVVHHTERAIEPRIWIACPEGVKTLINPCVWNILNKALQHTGCNLLQWLTNPNYRPTNPNLAKLNQLKTRGFQRGLNAFYTQYDKIVQALLEIKAFKGNVHDVLQFITEYRDVTFCSRLPIPSRVAFIIEKANTGTYADPDAAKALDAIHTISSIKSSVVPYTLKQREVIALKAIMQLTEYHDTVYKNIIARKQGWYRKHIFGSRAHFTARGVITSITDNHNHNDCHLPWSMSVNLMKVHLTNKLLKRGFTPQKAYSHIIRHLNKYCPLLDELMAELGAEGPDGYMWCLIQRNPSLRRGSAQLFRIAKIKKDPADLTIGFGINVVTAPNADFDKHHCRSKTPLIAGNSLESIYHRYSESMYRWFNKLRNWTISSEVPTVI